MKEIDICELIDLQEQYKSNIIDDKGCYVNSLLYQGWACDIATHCEDCPIYTHNIERLK